MARDYKQKTSADVLQDMATRLEQDFERLAQIEAIVKTKPHWQTEEPALKELLKDS